MNYTNADSLLNKISELEVLIGIVKPDIIVVTELFPKTLNPTNIDKNEYKSKDLHVLLVKLKKIIEEWQFI